MFQKWKIAQWIFFMCIGKYFSRLFKIDFFSWFFFIVWDLENTVVTNIFCQFFWFNKLTTSFSLDFLVFNLSKKLGSFNFQSLLSLQNCVNWRVLVNHFTCLYSLYVGKHFCLAAYRAQYCVMHLASSNYHLMMVTGQKWLCDHGCMYAFSKQMYMLLDNT